MIVPAQIPNPHVKPRWQASVGVMESVVAYNCRKYGFPHPILAMPFWEGAGNMAMDYSGNGNHGTLVGNPKWVADGLEYDGAGDTVDVGDITVEGTDLTISAWINVDDVTSDQRSIVTKYDVASDAVRAFMFSVDIGGSIRFYTWDGTPNTGKKTAVGVISINTPHQVMVVYDYDANDADIYVDNVLKANSQRDDVLDKIQNVATHVRVGGRVGVGDDMDGTTDQLIIHNVKLTQVQRKFMHDDPWFMYRMPEELYGYVAAAAGISIPSLMQQMNQFDGGTYALC